MTTFLDGPAKGQNLLLKRAPFILRVVELDSNQREKWDALDQIGDEPSANEKLYAYKIFGKPSMCHLNFGRKGGGFYTVAEYKFIEPQPPDDVMRNKLVFEKWCEQFKSEYEQWKKE